MDYMKTVGENKYQTNFFIRTQAFLEIEKQYNYDNAKSKAEKLYETLEKRYDDIKSVNFAGSDLDKDFLMWILIPLLIKRLENKADDIITQKQEYFYCMPKRKDGSEHWIRAFLKEDDYISSLPDEVKNFSVKTDYHWCDPWIPNEILSFQIDFYATDQIIGARNALRGREFQELARILVINNPKDIFDAITDYDKILVARYAEMGLVKVDRNQDKILIPYLKKDEYEKFDKILLEIESELGDDFFVDYIEGYMKKVKEQVPDFLPDNEKNYVATGISCIAAIPYYLSDIGKLRYPTDEEAKRLGIIIWEVK